jgi:hypothetical protein
MVILWVLVSYVEILVSYLFMHNVPNVDENIVMTVANII